MGHKAAQEWKGKSGISLSNIHKRLKRNKNGKMAVIDNYNRVRERVTAAADSAGRDADSVRIIAVSKTFPPEIMQEALNAGITEFGENKIQEAKNKIPRLRGNASFHMIGHLQSNKAKEAVNFFDVIHSIDKYGTAEKVSGEAEKINKIQKILIQVNTSQEDSKSGVDPDDVIQLAEKIRGLKNLELLGLMTMAPFTEDRDIIRSCFRMTADLLNRINKEGGTPLKELSMGMSHDFEIAVEEGATIVRIGGLIFGERT